MTFLHRYLRTFGALIISLIALTLMFTSSLGVSITRSFDIDFLRKITTLERSFYDMRMRTHLNFNENCIAEDPSNFFFSRSIDQLPMATKDCSPENFDKMIKFFQRYPQTEGFAERITQYAQDKTGFGYAGQDNEELASKTEDLTKKLRVKFTKLAAQFSEKLKQLKKETNTIFTGDILESINDPEKRFVSQDIVLLQIDDYSLQKINSWPIPREIYTDVVNRLSNFGTKVLAFDILFPEEVKACNDVSPDDGFANSIDAFQQNGGRVIMAYSTEFSDHNQPEFFNEVPAELFMNILESRQEDENVSVIKSKISKATWPIEKLLVPEPDLGFLSNEEDFDGVFRQYRVFSNVDSLFFPSLGYRAYQSFTDTNYMFHVMHTGEVLLEIENEQNLKLNERGEAKLRWMGYKRNFDTISLYDLISADPNDPELKKLLNNKIVFIGSTALGAHDLRNSPIDTKLPGIYAHMNFTEMMLQKFFYKSVEDSFMFSLTFLLVSMMILLFTMMLKNASLDIIVLLLTLGLLFVADYYYFIPEGYEIQLFMIYACLISTYSFITLINFNNANAEKKQIKGAFSRYVAPSIVDDMLDHPEKLKVGGEKKDITCLFSDVRDFTSISEKLTPAELSQCLNRYMGEMTDIVFATNGTLDKYIGDAIVAFWGAPIDIGDHVNQSIDAAVRMLEALPAINKEFKEKGFPEFEIGLGLNSGECSVGNMGSDQIFAYTALGDNMNLGARLESLCKHYGAQILISEYTWEKLDHTTYTTRLIDKVRVKGKIHPVGVYEVLYSYHPFMIDELSLENFKKGYALYVEGKFLEAKKIFEEILSIHPKDKSSQRLLESTNHWIANPPGPGDEWAITTMTSK